MKSEYYLFTDCGHRTLKCDIYASEDRITEVEGLCRCCREARVGQEIEFVRFGHLPAAGRSRNHRDGQAEEGISVYEIRDGRAILTGFHFGITERKTAYRGTGRIVGWGSDGEPLVEVISSKKLTAKQLASLVD